METRITDREQATENSFGYINKRGLFEPINLVQHLKNIGVWDEPTATDKRGLTHELTAYYAKLKATIESIK